MYKTLEYLLKTRNFNDPDILNLFIPVIYYENKEAFLTTPDKIKNKSYTPNNFTYTEDFQLALAFNDINEVHNLIELKGLDYATPQFKDLYTKAYTIAMGNDKNNITTIKIDTSWKPVNYYQEETNIITTTDYDLALNKLKLFKYKISKFYQNRISDIAKIQLI